MALWNGQALGGPQAPALGFTLSSAQLIPGFVEQALGTGLFAHTEDTQLTPLDDLKAWMRSDPHRQGALFTEVAEVLLGEEKAARAAAKKAGVEFDPVGWELGQLEEDPTYDSYTASWAGLILRLVIEEADEIQAFSRKENGCDFALAVSFQLPDPRKHPRFSREAIAVALAERGALGAAKTLTPGQAPKLELSGAFQLDLGAKQSAGPSLERRNGVGFVRVPAVDGRAGDATIAWLSLAYPIESEGYFLMTFDALRQSLALKDDEA